MGIPTEQGRCYGHKGVFPEVRPLRCILDILTPAISPIVGKRACTICGSEELGSCSPMLMKKKMMMMVMMITLHRCSSYLTQKTLSHYKHPGSLAFAIILPTLNISSAVGVGVMLQMLPIEVGQSPQALIVSGSFHRHRPPPTLCFFNQFDNQKLPSIQRDR